MTRGTGFAAPPHVWTLRIENYKGEQLEIKIRAKNKQDADRKASTVLLLLGSPEWSDYYDRCEKLFGWEYAEAIRAYGWQLVEAKTEEAHPDFVQKMAFKIAALKNGESAPYPVLARDAEEIAKDITAQQFYARLNRPEGGLYRDYCSYVKLAEGVHWQEVV